MSENQCPDCEHESVSKEFNDRNSVDGDEVWDCVCKKCGCEYTVTYSKEIDVYKHGEGYEDEEDV